MAKTPLNDPSGTGFFGKGYWGHKVFWMNVPIQWRRLDVDHHLQRLLMTWGFAGEQLLDQIESLPLQRDPHEVRTRSSWTRWFYVTESFPYEDEERGEVVRLIGEKDFSLMPNTDPDNPPIPYPTSKLQSDINEWLDRMARHYPWWPYEPLSEVARYWELYWRDAKYQVINVRARNYDQPEIYNPETSLANEVWVQGGDLVLVFDYMTDRLWTNDLPNIQGTRVIGYTDGSHSPKVSLPDLPVRLKRNVNPTSLNTDDARVVVQVTTIGAPGGIVQYLYDVPDGGSDVNTGRLCSASGGVITPLHYGTVNYLTGEIIIDMNLSGGVPTFGEPVAIRAKYMVEGYFMKFNAPPNIDFFAKDYGLKNDQNDPEDVQRSLLANVTKYWGKKATHDSYRIRGEISLFDVGMQGLFRINQVGLAQLLPASSIYEIGTTLYTDVQPFFLKFDHINSDEQFYDYVDGVASQWVALIDNMFVAENEDRWDGMTIGQGFAVDVCQGYYAPVSQANATKRGPARVEVGGVVQTVQSDLEEYAIANGFTYTITMKRCQWEAFNFPTKGNGGVYQDPPLFAISKYEHNASPTLGVPPAVDDDYFYIDIQKSEWTVTVPGATTDEDVGEWVVVITVGAGVTYPPIPEDSDVAIRYVPSSLDTMSCDYCRSNRLRALVGVTEEAYDFYDDFDDIDFAIERLKDKLRDELVPMHARIIEWEITRRIEDEMFGVNSGADVTHEYDYSSYEGAVEITVSVQYKGDGNGGSIVAFIEFYDGTSWTAGWTSDVFSPTGDVDMWCDFPASTYEVIMTGDEGMRLRATADSSIASGDIRWTISVTKKEG